MTDLATNNQGGLAWMRTCLIESPAFTGTTYLGVGGFENFLLITVVRPQAVILVDVDARLIKTFADFFAALTAQKSWGPREREDFLKGLMISTQDKGLLASLQEKDWRLLQGLAVKKAVTLISGDITSPTFIKKLLKDFGQKNIQLGTLYFSDFLDTVAPTGYVPRVVNLWDLFREEKFFHRQALTFMTFQSLPGVYKNTGAHYVCWARRPLLELLEAIESGDDFAPAYLAVMRQNLKEPSWCCRFEDEGLVLLPENAEEELDKLQGMLATLTDKSEQQAWIVYGKYLRRVM